MARIAGVDLPRRKAIAYALPYIYGIGLHTAKVICAKANIPPERKVDELSEGDVKTLRETIETYKVEGDLRRDVSANLRRHIEMGSYRGHRHRRNLPVHGQRTHTNARTRKGPRKTVAGKKTAPSKG